MTLPKIRILFHYGAHNTAEDARNIGKVLAEFKPQVYSWEDSSNASAPDALKRMSREVSRAKKDPQARRDLLRRAELGSTNPEFAVRQVGEIIDAYKLHRLFCMEYDKSRAPTRAHQQALDAARRAFARGEWEEALEKAHESAGLSLKASKERDASIVKNAETLAEQLVALHPELAGEGEIRVYARIGTGHTPAYHAIRKRGISVERVFDSKPAVVAAESRLWANLEGRTAADPRHRTALARYILKTFIYGCMDGVENSDRVEAAASIIAEKFSEGEIREISEKSGGLDAVEKAIVKGALAKGTPIPGNDREAGELIGKHVKIDFSAPWWATPSRKRA